MRFLLLLALAGPSFAQFNSSGPPGAVVVQASPSGQTCTTATAQAKIYNGTIYTCQSGTYAAVSAGGGGTGNVSASGTPTTSQFAQWTDATHVKGVSQGIFNVRTMYGAIPDGSTDNATAIASAFTASNAMTTGTPTVYFDCDTSSTTCQYNYGGSGISAINPLIPTNIECATGVTLNYTGSAHVVDLGPINLTKADGRPYTIQGCTFTGAASSTQGIYVNSYVIATRLIKNFFYNFGNRTGANIRYVGNNWEPFITNNVWWDSDGVTRNILDAHDAFTAGLNFSNNTIECETAGGTACSVATIGYGLWVPIGGTIEGNVVQYHQPLIRASSQNSQGTLRIVHNHFEGNTNAAGPAITFGNPGGTAVTNMLGVVLEDNVFYWPAASGVSYIGPETPASGSYTLSRTFVTRNTFASTPAGSSFYFNTNGGINNVFSFNYDFSRQIIRTGSSPAISDNDGVQMFAQTSGTALVKGDSKGGFATAVASDVAGLFTGCTGSQYLGADGACHGLNNSGNVYYPASDSTTAFGIDKADGTTPIFKVDSTNQTIGFNFPTLATGRRSYMWNAASGALKLQRWSDNFGTASSSILKIDNSISADTLIVDAGTLSISGGQTHAISSKSSAYTVTVGDYNLLCNATSAAFTLTLPLQPATGETHSFKKTDSSANACTVSGNGKNIDGGSTLSLSTQYQTSKIQYDGTQWWVF